MSGPKVELIDFTGSGRPNEEWHAANVMIFTKSTRLELCPGLFQEIEEWPAERKMQELEYMAATIPSSWEFAHFTFLISDVSRACAQQITRTRTGSYAMQSQRVANVAAAQVTIPEGLDDVQRLDFKAVCQRSINAYADLVKSGWQPQDARGVLPINIHCNLVAGYNLRSLADLVVARSSLRTQGEYASIIAQMKATTMQKFPWIHLFFKDRQEAVIAMLEEVAHELGVVPGDGLGWKVAKAIDLLRKA